MFDLWIVNELASPVEVVTIYSRCRVNLKKLLFSNKFIPLRPSTCQGYAGRVKLKVHQELH